MIDNELVIVGDEAYTREEWEADERRAASKRAYRLRNPEKERARVRRWAERHPDQRRAYAREWQQRYRAEKRRQSPEDRLVRVVASLHGLSCAGPTRNTGCHCHKTLVVEPVRDLRGDE